MNFNVDIKGNTLIVYLKGELDDYIAKSIKDKIDYMLYRKDIIHIIFDLSEVDFMDSAGIGLIIGRYKIIKPRGGKGMIVCSAPYVNRILKMSGVYNLFTNFETADKAYKSIQTEAII